MSMLMKIVPALLLAGGALNAVTFGEPDGNRHPWVGTLLFEAADGQYYSCTGTLLSPTVMVTAAHCTMDNGVKNLRTWVTFAPAISFAGRKAYASLADYLDDKKNGWMQAADVIPHPQYRGTYPNTYDVGVVKLKQSAPVRTFGVLPTLGFLDTVRNRAENVFTVVGYGLQGYIKPFYEDRYERYMGEIRLVELRSAFDGAEMSAKFTNNPGKTSGGSCYGDSGGPVFYAGTNMVTAVVSWGITPCIGVEYNFRLDTPVAQEFVRSFL